MMGHNAQKKWFYIVANYGKNQSQQELENCIERFLLLFMEEDISLDIKEWMSEVKKPWSMSSHLNYLIDYTPIPVLPDGKRPKCRQIYVISVLPLKRDTTLV
jgi:hypothetical protein